MSSEKLERGAKLALATHNAGKVREMREMLLPYGIETVSATDLGVPEPEETGATFEANASLKALATAKATGLPALADDSGFCLSALDGAPGIYSARWSKNGDFDYAMQRVHQELDGSTDKTAWFVCVLALAWPDGRDLTFRGEVWGQMAWPPRGERGFGYDPIFQPSGHTLTFGEMSPSAKHGMSHRAYAFRLLANTCLKR